MLFLQLRSNLNVFFVIEKNDFVFPFHPLPCKKIIFENYLRKHGSLVDSFRKNMRYLAGLMAGDGDYVPLSFEGV